ncbi:MAG: ROK family protein [Verrucomicrobia bacterium]|nr:ROK family protein [Verrucomicrobiota bacterium]
MSASLPEGLLRGLASKTASRKPGCNIHMRHSSKTLPEDSSLVPAELGQETPGINAILQRSHNTQLVLHLFQLHRRLTRAEIAVRTGLTFQTVANILERLHKRRWVRKLPPQRLTVRGAESVPFELRGDAACSIGLQIDRDHISGLILNLAGEPLSSKSTSVLSPSPNQALKTLGKFVKEFREIPGVERHLLGVGIAFSGLYDAIRDQIDHPHLLLAEGWRGLRVRETFGNLSNPASASARPAARPVSLIQTDSHAAAVGEYWERFGQAPRCLAYVYFGIGLGCGIIYRGRHFAGSDGLAGEIAHLPAILETEQRKTARLCECGRRGCLETYFSFSAFLRDLGPADWKGSAPEALVESVRKEKKGQYRRWVQQAARRFWTVLPVLGPLLNPGIVLLGGPVPAILLDDLVAALAEIRSMEAVDDRLFYPRVERARLNQDAALIGVATGVLYEALRPIFGLKE